MPSQLRLIGLILRCVLAAGLVYFAVRLLLYHFFLVTYPYPNTLREGAMMTNTYALVHGFNPFNMDLQPQYTNTYGIVYPLLMWPFAKIFGVTMLIHRLVIAACIGLSCLLVFGALQKMEVPLLLNLWAVLMFYASCVYPKTSTPCIDPGACGMMFFLASVLVPFLDRYSYRSLMASAVFAALAFFTKPYCVLGVIIMGSYLLGFVSKKKGLMYGVCWLVLMTAGVLVVNATCQAYFDNCFFGQVNGSKAWATMERLYMQIQMYWDLHKWILVSMAVLGGAYLWKIKPQWPPKIFSMKLNEPFLKIGVPLWLWAAAWAAFVLYASLGRNNGATLWYFFQLLSPFLLMGAAWIFSRFSFWPLLVAVLLYNLHVLTLDDHDQWFKKDMPGWPQISQLIEGHQHILNISLIAPLLVEQNKDVTDNGSSEGFGLGGDRKYIYKYLFKQDPRVIEQLTLYFYNIRTNVQNKYYDLIILQPKLLPMGVAEDIPKYYKLEGGIDLFVPQDRRPYAVTVWKPL